MGAKLIGDLGRVGSITRSEAKRMLTFCSTSGPLFMLGAVGAGMLASPAAGAVIALSHYMGALLNGLLYRALFPKDPPRKKEPVGASALRKGTLLDIFTDSMITSFRALGIICGYIVLFMMIADFLQYSGVLGALQTNWSKGLIKGCLEMTVGCSSISRISDLTLQYQCILCTFLISFGGLSIYAQSMSMLAGLNIGSLYYLLSKFSHGLLSGLAAWVLGPVILGSEAVLTGTFGREEIMSRLGFFYQLLFSTKMVIMIVFLFLITIFADKAIKRIRKRRTEC